MAQEITEGYYEKTYVTEFLFHTFKNTKVLIVLLSNGKVLLYEKMKLERADARRYKLIRSNYLILPKTEHWSLALKGHKRCLITTEFNSVLVMHPQ